MRKIVFWILLLGFNTAALIYLLSPTPQIPDLRDSVKSDEPGDTVQLSNVSAYYTNLSRQEVMDFYKSYYQGPFRKMLNHPPERAKVIFRDTMRSYYLEELVLPFKETLYVNGFEWQKDVFTKPDAREKNKLVFRGVEYPSKVSIRRFPVSPVKRVLNLAVLELGIGLIYWSYRKFAGLSK